MKTLVTGGAGFIGSNLVEELVKQGRNITVIDDFSTGSMDNLESVRDKVEVIQDSCSNLPKLGVLNAKHIFHLGIPSSSPMYKENPMLVGEAINDFLKVFEYAKENHSKVVYASTSSIYGLCLPPHSEDMVSEPFDYYTETRIVMERLAYMYYKLYGVKSAGMRFFSVYGSHEQTKGRYANMVSQFLWTMKDGKAPIVYGDGTQTRDFVHVSDVVKACIKASETELGCEVINVGTSKSTSFNHVIELINKSLGTSIKPHYILNPIKNYVYSTLADLTKAHKLLGYKPEISLEDAIESLCLA